MIRQQMLGKSGPLVGCLGYGAAVLEGYYGAVDESEGIATLRHALDAGWTMIDTSDFYGLNQNEMRVGRALKGYRDKAFLCTKFGIVIDEKEKSNKLETGWNGVSFPINGTSAYAAKALERSLKRLDTDFIDLWYLHYPDPGTPIEETVGAMAQAVKSGKVRYLGLSNVTAEQVRRAHKIHPIAAVEYEYSVWRSEAEFELLPTLRELGIALVPWSPLGYGFLTGKVDTIGKDEHFRLANPRFAGDNLEINRKRFAPFMTLAAELGITPTQLALAWLLNKGQDIFPIPGTRRAARIDENGKAADVVLDKAVMQSIDELAKPGFAEGATLL